MINIQRYKQFVNSKDFEYIYKIARHQLKNDKIKYLDSINENLKKCILDESILILYEHNIPIGFYIINIIKRNPVFSFSFIEQNKRGKGYSYELIKSAFEIFGKHYDKFVAYIHEKNLPSLKNLHKILLNEGYTYEKEKVTDKKGFNFYRFTIQGFE